MLIITRDESYCDKLRPYEIIIDGECAGKVESGETVQVDMTPGNHIVYLKIDWCKSNDIGFYCEDRDKIVIKCGNAVKGFKNLIGFLYVTVFRDKYLWAQRV